MSIRHVEVSAPGDLPSKKKFRNMNKSFEKRRRKAEEDQKAPEAPPQYMAKDDDWKAIEKAVGSIKLKGFKSQGMRVLGVTEKLPKSGAAIVISFNDREYALVRMPSL